MWKLLQMLGAVGFVVGVVFALYGLVKLGRAEEASASKPKIESGVPGVEITRVESSGAAESHSQGMTTLVLSGMVLAGSVGLFGYATLKGRTRVAV
ncbi:hypothetical protein [Zavarzinella formosa]|uniref:hypothetical protein n=1 Tax=Zavarzinella formosa TaxID=360055 RepID=UPI0002F3D84D|nr:hypothetical protein [Zavarzinella formosa]